MRRAALVAPRALVALVALAATAPASPARAESWCASPLVVHEWGVHVFGGDGRPAPAAIALPDWFFTPGGPSAAGRPTAVRDLPVDSGDRALPVLHFYAPPGGMGGDTIPVGIEVGFAGGDATAWYPAVDAPRPGRALVWDRLDLTPAPRGAPRATKVPWVGAARALDGALWVQAPGAAERFVFYEGATRDAVPLALARSPRWSPARRAYGLANRGAHPIHDVVVVHREGTRTYVFEAATIPVGGRVDFVLEDHATDDVAARTTARLRARLVEPPPPSDRDRMRAGDCVMGRDPAVPFEVADGHQLTAPEVELLLSVWGARFFEQPGTTILYREDVAALAQAMPLAIYTDMYHFVQLRRAGLALWEKVTLP